jgi:hypothetical protein
MSCLLPPPQGRAKLKEKAKAYFLILTSHSLIYSIGRAMLEHPKLKVFHQQGSQDHLKKDPF